MIRIKRSYSEPEEIDGYRILVDRLWPRGLTKERAKLDLWFKEIAPTTPLRKWFSHDPEKFSEFSKKYRQELVENEVAVNEAMRLEKEKGTITLIYGAKSETINHAIVLQNFLQKQK